MSIATVATMTYQPDFTLPSEILEKAAERGFEFLPELIRIIFNPDQIAPLRISRQIGMSARLPGTQVIMPSRLSEVDLTARI